MKLLASLLLVLATSATAQGWNPPPNQPDCPKCNPHVYGTPPGQPQKRFLPIALAAGWEPMGEGYAEPGFWRDPWGMVHLRGMARRTNDEPGFNGSTYLLGQLPEGYWVAWKESFWTPLNILVELTGDGKIWVHFGQPHLGVSLSGITFHAP